MADSPLENPFAVLGVAPTLDAGAVKRAYFAELAKHPPHTDPSGFQRLRAAYEALQKPEALALAFASAPLDVAAELTRWEGRFGARIKAAQERVRAEAQIAGRLQRFLDTTCRMTLTEAQAAYALSAPSEDAKTP